MALALGLPKLVILGLVPRIQHRALEAPALRADGAVDDLLL
jgi:hypothetical protein